MRRAGRMEFFATRRCGRPAAGTPAGVGPIKGGDQIKIEFERIGSMTVSVAQSSGGKASIFASA